MDRSEEKEKRKVTFQDLISGRVKLEFGNLEQIAAIDEEIRKRRVLKKEEEWEEAINSTKENIYG